MEGELERTHRNGFWLHSGTAAWALVISRLLSPEWNCIASAGSEEDNVGFGAPSVEDNLWDFSFVSDFGGHGGITKRN